MALTAAERDRLEALEVLVDRLNTLITGAGSKNQLNRLLVLAGNMNNQNESRLTTLETQVEELLALVRKLQ